VKRAGNLWPDLSSFVNLLTAAKRAAAGKRRRADVAAFALNLEGELVQLRRELLDGSYQPGPYRSFQVMDPKPRLISAAPFRDRVVHHALTQVLEPIFERRFSKDSFACRQGFGTHRALAQARDGARRCSYVLKCDVKKYFASVDHEILSGLLARAVKCRDTLELAAKIIDASNPQEEAISYFPGDDLFTPFERRRGLPLGNQTSQFFANVYLNPLDQIVNRELRPQERQLRVSLRPGCGAKMPRRLPGESRAGYGRGGSAVPLPDRAPDVRAYCSASNTKLAPVLK
jgi:RNA-directed DNA polymerase